MWRGLLVLAGGLALAGCATYGAPGGYGGYGYPGGQGAYGGNPYGNAYAEAVEGTVVGVDRGYQRIVIDRGGYGGRGGQVAIRYDRRTALTYRGRQYPVEGLERGDVVRVEGAASGGQLHARHIVVLRNVRESGYGYGYPGGGYGADPYHPGDPAQGYAEFRGRVEFVDPRARVIRIQGGGYAMTDLPLLRPEHVDGHLAIGDDEAVACARRLAREEGVFAGFSSGANLAAALRLLRGAHRGQTVVILVCDSGLKYLSTDLWA
jgi:hypothetical protein